MRMKLSRKIALFVGVLIIVVSAALGITAIKYSSDALMDETNQTMQQYAKESSFRIDAVISKNLAALSEVARRTEITSMDFAVQRQLLIPDMERLGYKGMMVADTHGKVRDISMGAETELMQESFIRKALTGKVCMSDVMIDKITGEPAILEAAPIVSNERVVGVLIGRRDANFLSTITNELGMGKRGYAFIVGVDGTLYADQDKEKVLNQANIFGETEKDAGNGLGTKLKKLGLGKVGMLEYEQEGQSRVLALAPIPNTYWTLGVGNYKDDIMTGVNSLRNIILVLSSAIAVAGICGAILLGNVISKPIVKLSTIAGRLAHGDPDVEVSSSAKDEVGDLIRAFGEVVDNIKTQAEAGRRIAEGNLSVEITAKSDKDVLAHSMISVVNTLRNLVSEVESLIASAVEGRLSNRGDAGQFMGVYQEIIQGFNNTLDAVIEPLNAVAEHVDRISKGDIPDKITEEYKGDFNTIKTNLNACIDAVGMLVSDTRMLADAAIKGDFLKRAEAEKHQGDFRKVIEGINTTFDTVADKAVWYESIIDAIPYPISVTDMDMKWTYMNKAFERDMIAIGVIEDRESGYGIECRKAGANICGTEDCGIRRLVDKGIGESYFDWEKYHKKQVSAYLKDRNGKNVGFVEVVTDLTEITSINRYTENEVRRLDENLKLLAKGNLDLDLNIAEADEYTSEVAAQFRSIGRSLEEVKTAIGALIADAAGMTEAAIGGNLRNRADISRHGGEFVRIIEGFNKTLDAVIEPIYEASTVLTEMAKGNLQITMEGEYQGDHAVIKNALNETIESIRSYISEISEVLTEISCGNLNLAITADYKGDFVEIKTSLNNILESLNQVLGEISGAADQVASGARQVSDGSQALSQGSTEQASSIEQLTASMYEIADQTKNNAANANQASELAKKAMLHAKRGDQQMQEMLLSMQDISQSSENISKIIKVIDDIAFQTNILALNAAVEAARAGQHGKGFAVVAEEVRNLAARSAEAAKNTTDMIEGSIAKVQAGMKIANETAAALNDIVKGVEQAADLSGRIAEASSEQASAIVQINKGIEQVSMVTQNNSATAEESAAASEELSGQAEFLKEMVGRFRLTGLSLPGQEIRLLGEYPEEDFPETKDERIRHLLLS